MRIQFKTSPDHTNYQNTVTALNQALAGDLPEDASSERLVTIGDTPSKIGITKMGDRDLYYLAIMPNSQSKPLPALPSGAIRMTVYESSGDELLSKDLSHQPRFGSWYINDGFSLHS